MSQPRCNDPAVLDLWHPISTFEEARPEPRETVLLQERLGFAVSAGQPRVWRIADAAPLPALYAYGFIWSCLGSPPERLFDIPEYHEPDRTNVCTGSFGVNVSAPRAVENFLDMGHFPYVHTGLLGEEPHTEVKEYDVEISSARDEILATRCRFYQPKAMAASDSGADVEYIYRVPHPFCSVLYKSSPMDEERMDVVALFLQPFGEEHVCAHTMMSLIDDRSDNASLRLFQQTIFGQDKPILENQYPKRLPLDPRAETPIRADKSAIAYRRWLSTKGITYGVIPAAA